MKGKDGQSFEYVILKDIYSMVLVLDSKGRIQYINEPASIKLEIPNSIEPRDVHFIKNIENEYNDRFREYILEAIYRKDKRHQGIIKYLAPSGKKHVFRMSSSYLEDYDYINITIEDLTLEYKLAEKVKNASIVFSEFLFMMGTWVLFCEFWDTIGRPISRDILTIFIEIFGAVVFIVIFRSTHATLEELGITNGNNKRAVINGILISAVFAVIMFAIKIIGRMIDPTLFHPEKPFFNFIPLVALTYVVTAGVQEFLARCVVQHNLQAIVQGKYKEAIAIVLSSLLFATLHVYYGFAFMMGAALLGVIEGIIYVKQESLISVWIVHYVFGVVGMSLSLV